ncbi:MAG: patatin-like phospholipase family protein [Deltaproteobacteria bacterium]|nr:patatin-like phospholipase family protein [Deltaproteobacteria bacterium]
MKRRQKRPGRRHKLGLVLSGGGARGAFQVGVYERLLRDARFADGPTVLSGTSAGAINSALIAAGKSPREMMDFWNGIADNPPAVASEVFFRTATQRLARLALEEGAKWLWPGRRWTALWQRARNHFPPRRGSGMALIVEYLLTARFELISDFLQGIKAPFVADTSQLRERLIDAMGGEEVPNRGIDLAINTVNAHTGHVVRYVTTETTHTRPPDYHIVDAITVDMIMASCSIPLLFPPVRVGPHLLWDGGLLVNTPLAPVVALGAEEIITVLVTEPADREEPPFPHFGRAVERTVDSFLENAYNVDRKLLLERNRLAEIDAGRYRAVTLYEAVRPARDNTFNAGSYLYFERGVLAAMHAAGRRAANSWLGEGPLVDRLEESAAGAAA